MSYWIEDKYFYKTYCRWLSKMPQDRFKARVADGRVRSIKASKHLTYEARMARKLMRLKYGRFKRKTQFLQEHTSKFIC